MEKPIYKYVTVWGILGGTALAFLYLKTLGKDKNLALAKTLLIGGAIGGGVGLGFDLAVNRKPKPVTEEDLKEMAKPLGKDVESELDNYLLLMKKAKLSDIDNQRVLNVIKGFLLAKKDKKWDESANIQVKKQILMSYGVTSDDFQVFEDVIIKGVVNALSGLLSKTAKKGEIK